MCIEDIAISRRFQVKEATLPFGVALRLPANPDRIAVRIGNHFSAPCVAVIGTNAIDTAAGRGVKSSFVNFSGADNYVGNWDLVLDYRIDGPIVQGELWLFVATADARYWETTMMPELAAEVAREATKWSRK